MWNKFHEETTKEIAFQNVSVLYHNFEKMAVHFMIGLNIGNMKMLQHFNMNMLRQNLHEIKGVDVSFSNQILCYHPL